MLSNWIRQHTIKPDDVNASYFILEKTTMKLYFESLGCARNQVDSEIMIGRLKKAGWQITDDPGQAETIVVNTCSFIEDATQESIEVILELAEYKKEGACKRLVVAGCLPGALPRGNFTVIAGSGCLFGDRCL